jgi:uncharacterized protein YyaL (SSP411 family)
VNHLKDQSSPYLQQHAGNPVDWYPWGEEAFAEARRQDKPVFLSIGYSTCHWCHVMEEESFADPEVAALMNAAFVSIKVDREERPDIDQLYMTVCQLATGQGGWPLTVLLTPEQKPFFAATYIPKAARLGMSGLLELIPRVQELWATRRQEIEGSAVKLLQALRQALGPAKAGELPGEQALRQAYRELAGRFDAVNGGFGAAPKFPSPHTLMFLLRAWKRSGEAQALAMVERTLQAMRRGGIFDQVGFGFHRYATDARWNIPHYEKMLYDQALLTLAYIEAFQATGRQLYRSTAEEVLAYLLRDLRSPEGAFFCAEDADTEGEEGRFYLWSRVELVRALSLEGLAELEEAAALEQAPEGGLLLALKDAERPLPEPLRQRLFELRSTRVRPFRDEKVLSGWNGLAIAALARAGGALERPDYTAAAEQAARFILERMRDREGRLLHRYRAGEAGIPAFAEDYAYLAWGLLELYETAFDSAWLEEAFRLTDELLDGFWDGSPDGSGGLFLSAEHAESLIVRPRSSGDGALPGVDSVALANLLKLGRIGDRRDYELKAEQLLRLSADLVRRYPSAYAHLLAGVDFLLGPSYEVVIAGDPGAEDTSRLAGSLRRAFQPNKVLLLRPDIGAASSGGAGRGEAEHGEPDGRLLRLAPFVRDYRAGPEGRALAYVCRGYACRLPTADPAEMLRLLEEGD